MKTFELICCAVCTSYLNIILISSFKFALNVKTEEQKSCCLARTRQPKIFQTFRPQYFCRFNSEPLIKVSHSIFSFFFNFVLEKIENHLTLSFSNTGFLGSNVSLSVLRPFESARRMFSTGILYT